MLGLGSRFLFNHPPNDVRITFQKVALDGGGLQEPLVNGVLKSIIQG